MSTYTQILYQIVFGSKNYTHFLNEQNQGTLFSYMAKISQEKNCKPYIIGGHSNHIHMIVCIHPMQNLASFVKEIKNSSHNMMMKNQEMYKLFPGWQVGYGGFTYNYASKGNLIQYVERQAAHHEKVSFQEELVALCEEFGVVYDTKYLII